MASPPKPWERAGPLPSGSSPSSSPPTATTTTSPTLPTSSSEPPSVPARPASLSNPPISTSPYTTTASPYATTTSPYTTTTSPYTTTTSPYTTAASPYNTSAASPYNNTLSPYSPYSRFGSTYTPYGGNTLYGGGLGYGTMGGYNYGGYGMNSMYGGMPGGGMYPGMDPNNSSLTQTLEATTQHTFSLLHSIVQTFTGVAQMLESTFMATHSSFFAMVGVIEQFSHLQNALGSVLGLFGLVRWMKQLITGKPSSPMRGEFREFINGRPVQGPLGPPAPRPSKKPLILFFLAIIGIPYAMSKLIKILNERAQQQQQSQIGAQLGPLDPSQLSFARALYPFTPSSPSELALQENEIVAVMGKLDPATGMEVDPRLEVESEWWRGRTRDGREGWFPRKWVEILQRRKSLEEPKKID